MKARNLTIKAEQLVAGDVVQLNGYTRIIDSISTGDTPQSFGNTSYARRIVATTRRYNGSGAHGSPAFIVFDPDERVAATIGL